MKMNTIGVVGGVALLACAGCALIDVGRDADGFVRVRGELPAEAPSEYFVLRFEYPDGIFPATKEWGWRAGMTKWIFTEIRQLKDGSTIVEDGVAKPYARKVAGKNWHKLVKPRSRNVRVKFVDAGYSLAGDGVIEAPSGFVSLYNGRDLTGWKGVTREKNFDNPYVRQAASAAERAEMQAKADRLRDEHWHVRDGVLFFDGLTGGYSLATARDYRDFEFQADWRLLRVFGDSGFYLRGAPQVQIWDPNMWWGLGSGCIWNNAKGMSAATQCADRPVGDWNRCRMRLVGDRLTVWLNGVKVVDNVTYENLWKPGEPLPAIEQIELQCHGDPIEFRNIFIREL